MVTHRPPPGKLKTIDAHTAGEPLRLIVEGWPEPRGRTQLERRAWARQHQDHLRRALMWEPRGHFDMYGALLTAPERADSHAGVLFMHNEGFSTMCGHGVIAVVTIALERGLLAMDPDGRTGAGAGAEVVAAAGAEGDAGPGAPASARTDDGAAAGADDVRVVLDSPAGQIRARATIRRAGGSRRVSRVSFVNVPSFVLASAVPVRVGARTVPVDVAFGGAFYAIVDAEAAGIPLRGDRLADLRAAGMTIKHAVEAAMPVVHPLEPGITGIYGTIFTGPPSVPGADLRNVTIFAEAEVDRSPCGTGTCAVLSVLDAMKVTDDSRPFVHESIVGTTFSARVAGRTRVGDCDAIVPELSGEAWITGEHTFLIDSRDPLRGGFRIGV